MVFASIPSVTAITVAALSICACRAAGLLARAHHCAREAKRDLATFLNERWKGVYPVAWGDTLRENEFTQWIYAGVCDMHLTEEETL